MCISTNLFTYVLPRWSKKKKNLSEKINTSEEERKAQNKSVRGKEDKQLGGRQCNTDSEVLRPEVADVKI